MKFYAIRKGTKIEVVGASGFIPPDSLGEVPIIDGKPVKDGSILKSVGGKIIVDETKAAASKIRDTENQLRAKKTARKTFLAGQVLMQLAEADPKYRAAVKKIDAAKTDAQVSAIER